MYIIKYNLTFKLCLNFPPTAPATADLLNWANAGGLKSLTSGEVDYIVRGCSNGPVVRKAVNELWECIQPYLAIGDLNHISSIIELIGPNEGFLAKFILCLNNRRDESARAAINQRRKLGVARVSMEIARNNSLTDQLVSYGSK